MCSEQPNTDLEGLAGLVTEQPNERSRGLDRLAIEEMLAVFNAADHEVPQAVQAALPQIAAAVRLTSTALAAGGRLFLCGAGTSGRLAVLEAAECPPTFSTPPEMVQAFLAGGPAALLRSAEGLEDQPHLGAEDTRAHAVGAQDVLIGISASGRTPYVLGALEQAGRLQAQRILLTCNPVTQAPAEVIIAVVTGPEVLAGSTRLKAGSATKMVLNMITTATMVRLGKVYNNLMVDLNPASRKLVQRAARIIRQVTGCDSVRARQLLEQAGNAKVAILMELKKLDPDTARARLAQTQGFLWQALQI